MFLFTNGSLTYSFGSMFQFFFPPFILHLYCITRFEDEDAICIIKY